MGGGTNIYIYIYIYIYERKIPVMVDGMSFWVDFTI